MSNSKAIQFLYESVIGRALLGLLVSPSISKIAARYLSSHFSSGLIPGFIDKNNIDIDKFIVPEGGYQSFNDFFTRKMKSENIVIGNGMLISPCDGLLTVSDIDEQSIFYIKHTEYGICDLLGDEKLAKDFIGGKAYIFRLTPAHYHRYVFCTYGKITGNRFIHGILHSVQPICHEKTKVFVQNSRDYTVIDNPEIGKVVQMEVGAMLVGKITNHDIETGMEVTAGKEKGYFEYGGSSIVVLTQSANPIVEEIANRQPEDGEIPVSIGENIFAY